MWSTCRIGAVQKGSRQQRSRSVINLASQPVNRRGWIPVHDHAAAAVAGPCGEQPPPPPRATGAADDLICQPGRDRPKPVYLFGLLLIGVE
jgi:hypothetical protein